MFILQQRFSHGHTFSVSFLLNFIDRSACIFKCILIIYQKEYLHTLIHPSFSYCFVSFFSLMVSINGTKLPCIEFHKFGISLRRLTSATISAAMLCSRSTSVQITGTETRHSKQRAFGKQEKSLLIDMFIELPPDPPEKCCRDNGTLDKLMGLVYVHGMLAKCHRVYQYLLENAVINIFLGITLVSTRTSAAAINSIQVPEELATM